MLSIVITVIACWALLVGSHSSGDMDFIGAQEGIIILLIACFFFGNPISVLICLIAFILTLVL